MSEPKKNPKEPIFTSQDTLVVVFDGPRGQHPPAPATEHPA
jgi:hypothetical protein